MNVLEKILEEIDKKRESLIDMSNDEPELCDVEDWYDEGVDNGKIKAYCDAMEIIRSHMDEVTNMSGKRLIDANDGWIPVSKRLPEVPEGTEDFYCPEFNVTIKDASKATTLKYAPDGTWFDDSGEVYNVMAWQPLPEPYRPEEE